MGRDAKEVQKNQEVANGNISKKISKTPCSDALFETLHMYKALKISALRLH